MQCRKNKQTFVHAGRDFQVLTHEYLLSLSLVPAIFMAISLNTAPVGTRRAREVIGGALNEIFTMKNRMRSFSF